MDCDCGYDYDFGFYVDFDFDYDDDDGFTTIRLYEIPFALSQFSKWLTRGDGRRKEEWLTKQSLHQWVMK